MQTLTDSETYQEVVEASEALEEDSEASALLQDFQQKQRQMQQGGFDQSLLSELQGVKSEMDANDTIRRHRKAQEVLVELLQGTNDVISEQIVYLPTTSSTIGIRSRKVHPMSQVKSGYLLR